MKNNRLSQLLFTFMKIGLFTFGGGYAMIAMIEDLCVEKKKWITHDEMMNITVIAESTPGPIAINCATYVGYRQAGLVGALAATVGIVLPSFCIIYIISVFLENFLEIQWITHAFWGIQCAVGLLIADAALTMIKKMNKKPVPITLLTVSFGVMCASNLAGWQISSIQLMIAAALVGLFIFYLLPNHLKRGGKAQ